MRERESLYMVNEREIESRDLVKGRSVRVLDIMQEKKRELSHRLDFASVVERR